ncbi:phosphonate ABC transporter ATP-binding protein [Rhodobacterales bacterium 52_120_T64]|nr:phosphonate ABC transporter ATP-binding protein [Rhodobacterales bacterium 52_120_T64]
MLSVHGLTKTFGNNIAVENVSFALVKPQMIGIIGRSGAGKSTLLRMMNRMTDASDGIVRFDERDVLKLKGKEKRAWQADCAMIFQQFNLIPRLDVMTNVLMGRLIDHSAVGSILRLFSREERLQALAALDRLGIAEHAMKRAEALSGGQQQRVAIARALMQNPKIILADEPIASLDPMNAKIVMDALRQIHEEDGRTVICNLHTLDTARNYCDRVIGMRDGRVVFDGPSEMLTEDAAREIYGAGDEFNEAATSTSISAISNTATVETLIAAAE